MPAETTQQTAAPPQTNAPSKSLQQTIFRAFTQRHGIALAPAALAFLATRLPDEAAAATLAERFKRNSNAAVLSLAAAQKLLAHSHSAVPRFSILNKRFSSLPAADLFEFYRSGISQRTTPLTALKTGVEATVFGMIYRGLTDRLILEDEHAAISLDLSECTQSGFLCERMFVALRGVAVSALCGSFSDQKISDLISDQSEAATAGTGEAVHKQGGGSVYAADERGESLAGRLFRVSAIILPAGSTRPQALPQAEASPAASQLLPLPSTLCVFSCPHLLSAAAFETLLRDALARHRPDILVISTPSPSALPPLHPFRGSVIAFPCRCLAQPLPVTFMQRSRPAPSENSGNPPCPALHESQKPSANQNGEAVHKTRLSAENPQEENSCINSERGGAFERREDASNPFTLRLFNRQVTFVDAEVFAIKERGEFTGAEPMKAFLEALLAHGCCNLLGGCDEAGGAAESSVFVILQDFFAVVAAVEEKWAVSLPRVSGGAYLVLGGDGRLSVEGLHESA